MLSRRSSQTPAPRRVKVSTVCCESRKVDHIQGLLRPSQRPYAQPQIVLKPLRPVISQVNCTRLNAPYAQPQIFQNPCVQSYPRSIALVSTPIRPATDRPKTPSSSHIPGQWHSSQRPVCQPQIVLKTLCPVTSMVCSCRLGTLRTATLGVCPDQPNAATFNHIQDYSDRRILTSLR